MADLKTTKKIQPGNAGRPRRRRQVVPEAPKSESEEGRLIALGASPQKASFLTALNKGEIEGDADVDFSVLDIARHVGNRAG